jgi:hypothetical protein
MHLSTADQNNTATRIAKWVRENTIGYGAVATEVDRAGHPGAAVVAIASHGNTTCTAKVAVHPDRIVYASELGTHTARPITPKDAGRIVGGFLLLEGN